MEKTTSITPKNNNLKILKKHFSQCFDKNGNLDFEKLKKELSNSKIDFSDESYNLDWLGKSYARVLASDEVRTFLKENKEWNRKEENKNSQNLLIKGDNLEVLKHLSNAYYEQIKMIYIDPPYNTGNDGFVYNDDRKFTIQELKELAGLSEAKAKRILDFVQSNSNSHSAWLTFIYPRLYIARQLLKDDGVIFVSIDDNEVAQLKILMDEIFGEENFVGSLIWEKVKIRKNSALYFTENHDYILVYAKQKKQDINDKGWERKLLERTSHNYKNPDNDPNGPWIKGSIIANNPYNADYTITKPNGIVLLKPKNGYWRYSYESIQNFIKENRILWGKNDSYPMVKKYLKDAKDGLVPKTILDFETFGGNPDGANELKKIFNNLKVFTNPKPTKLIKNLIKIANTSNNDLILDFFAGSGTTADAVMQLNAEDGGNRKFILVQIDEPIDPKKNKTAFDFVKDELGVENPTIFDITKERIIRSAKKIKEENENIDIDLGFKLFETTPIWDNFIFKAPILDNQETFNFEELDDEKLEILLTTWKTFDGIPLSQELEEFDFNGYKGYYGNRKLYLIHQNFNSENLQALFNEIEKNPNFNPNIIIIFGYFFESAKMRELAENLKSLINKKSLEIDFQIRY